MVKHGWAVPWKACSERRHTLVYLLVLRSAQYRMLPKAKEIGALCESSPCAQLQGSEEARGLGTGRVGSPPRSVLGGLLSSSSIPVIILPSLPSHPHCLSLSLWICVCHPAGCASPAEKVKSHLEVPLEENVNRRVLEEGSLEARTIEDAIAVLR